MFPGETIVNPKSQAVIKPFFDPETCTYTYVVYEGDGSPCVIIDSVLNYDSKSGRTKTGSADEVVQFVRIHGLQTEWILETHAHADHLTAAPYLQSKLGGKIVIGDQIDGVQKVFQGIFNLGADFPVDGSQFDCLLKDEETLSFGNLTLKALYVPGHTPACMAYEIGDAIFVGDTLFMPDVGTARCDFPGGDARTLFRSIQRLLAYPAQTTLYMCHDYPPEGRVPTCSATIAQEREFNIHIHDGISEDAFVAMRTKRDQSLEMPALILPAIQINIRAGHFPKPEDDGTSFLKIPLNVL